MDKINYNELLKRFKNKKVFVTGHTGFKGSWLSYALIDAGADVMGYSLMPNYSPNHFDLLGLNNKLKHVIGDVRDLTLLQETIIDFKPDFVFHLAAQPLVQKSYTDPVETFSTNVMGTVNLLEVSRKCDSIKSLIIVTSDKCYENEEWIWGYRENDKMGGHDPYSSSKGAAELIFSSYFRSFFNDRDNFGAASVRAGNVIGGGDWSENRIIPDCIKAISNNKNILIRNPIATRPWQHVLEPLSGYLLLAVKLYDEPKKFSGSWNFGPTSKEVKTVFEVANLMVEHLGMGKVEITSTNTNHEANLLQLNCDKANQLLNWESKWNFQETIFYTADWYNKYLKGENVNVITKNQLNKYFNN
jgi:CDP-glucose 4,6-dehydratase